MPSAIGVRIYRIGISKDRTPQPLDHSDLRKPVKDFIDDYIKSHLSSTQDDQLERSWYFERRKTDGKGNCRGYIQYGTFGFESNFVDSKTKKKNYRRKTTDVEEIPLYFEFWMPPKEIFGYACFQSFQGRSCINLVMAEMKQIFEKENRGFTFTFRKLLPTDASQSVFRSAPVKRFRLIRRDAPHDMTDRYFNNPAPDSVNFEVTISARRNKDLGNFGNLFKSLKTRAGSVVTHDGIEFPEAVAEIRVGNRTRRVGMLGLNSDAGVIDITDDIKRGANGHPTFASIARETREILKDMYATMRGDKN